MIIDIISIVVLSILVVILIIDIIVNLKSIAPYREALQRKDKLIIEATVEIKQLILSLDIKDDILKAQSNLIEELQKK